MHRTDTVVPYPPHEIVPNTKGNLPPKAKALVANRAPSSDNSAARFFASDRFATLYAHAYDLGALQQPVENDSDGGTAVEAVLGLPRLRQLVLDADVGDERYLVPGADADDRQRLVDAWAARVVRVVPTQPVHTPEEWLKQQTAIARIIGPPTAKRLAVRLVTAVSRGFVTRPHRWALSGVAALFATTGAQSAFVQMLAKHLLPIFDQLYASDVDTVYRLSTDLSTALARQLMTLPGTVWSTLGDKRLSPTRAAGRIAIRVGLPLTTNLILLTPASTLVPVGAGVVGLTALLALTPLGDAVLGKTLATRAGQAGVTATLTGATALAARLTLQTIPGVSFAAGTLQFAISSQLTTQVAQSMLATMSDGQLISPEPGPSAFKLILEEAERHYVFLQFRYHARETTRKIGARFRRVYGATWGRAIDPLLPTSLQFLSPTLVASFATAWSLWFAYASLPFHLDALQYECHTWVVPLRNALKRLMPWLSGLGRSVGVLDNTHQAVTKEAVHRARMVYRFFGEGVYQQLWHPFLTHILQEQLELPARATAAVNGVLDACKRRYPWAKAVLSHKPFATVVKSELLQRWHLDYLFHVSLEHLCLRSPLSTFLSLATDTRQNAPQKLLSYLATDTAEPFVRSMRAIYDARTDVYTGVRLTFVEASLPPDTQRPDVAPEPVPTTTDALLNRLADAAERAHATAPPQAYAQLQDAWADYTEAFGPDQSDHHPDATADTQRRSAFVRLTRESQTNDVTTHQTFVHECQRLTRDLRHSVQKWRNAQTEARTYDLKVYRHRVEHETKRAYLRDIEYAAKVMRHKMGLNAIDAPTLLPSGFVAADVTEAELDADVSVDDLRTMAYNYRETSEAVAAWTAVHAEAQQIAKAPNAPPLPAALQERLDRTNQYAHRLLHPFASDKSAGIGRLWMGIKTHAEDLATLQKLTRATDVLVADYRRRLLVYQSYVALVGEAHRPIDPTDDEWTKMEAMAYAVKVVHGGVVKKAFVNALGVESSKNTSPQALGNVEGEIIEDRKGTQVTPNTVADVFAIMKDTDETVANKAQRVVNDRRAKWVKRGKQRDKALGDWDQVLRNRYGRREKALQTLRALKQVDLKGHTTTLRALRERFDRRRREGTLGLDDASRSPARVFAPDASTDLCAWVAANSADPATRKAHAEAQTLLGTMPDQKTLAHFRQQLKMDHDFEGLERFDTTLAQVQSEMDELRRVHDELTSLRKAAFWQHAKTNLAQFDRRALLQTRSWWPFASPRWTDWHVSTARAHRTTLDEHIRRVKATHLPVTPQVLETVDVRSWAKLVDAASPEQLPSIERHAVVAYLKALGDHEHRLRAYVDASLDTELARIVQPEVPLPADADASTLCKSTNDALAVLRANLVPYHAEREGYVHPLLQHLTTWTNVRYAIHDERQRVRQIIRAYADALHGKTDTYTTQRALSHAQRALTTRRQAWTNRSLLPPDTLTHRPDRAKSGHATITGKATTSVTRHVEAQLHATVEAESRTWEAELAQLDTALGVAEAMTKAAQSDDRAVQSTLADQCNQWETALAKIANTPDGAILADALRPQLLALAETDSLYKQMQALETAQKAWSQQLMTVRSHTKTSDSIVDYLTKPLTQINPFAPSLNTKTRTFVHRTATLSELTKQVERMRRARATRLSDAHAKAFDHQWDQLRRAREPTLRDALSYLETQFEESNAEYEKEVYTHDDKHSASHELQLNERRGLQYLAWQRLRVLQVPGRKLDEFAKDPRVVAVNQRVERHWQAIRLRDRAATEPWTAETLAKQRRVWQSQAHDPNVHEATVKANKAAYLTGRAKVLAEVYMQIEHAVAVALAKGAAPPATLETPDVITAMRAYNDIVQANPVDTQPPDPTESKQAALAEYVRQWPMRWKAVLDVQADGAAQRKMWVQRSDALVKDAPVMFREAVRARVEQRRPAMPKPAPRLHPTVAPDMQSIEQQNMPTLSDKWSWPWWKKPSRTTTPPGTAPPATAPPPPNALGKTLEEVSKEWDTYLSQIEASSLHQDLIQHTNPDADATYTTLSALDTHVEHLRKLSARYDTIYDRTPANERRAVAASTVRAAQRAQLRAAEVQYEATEKALFDHWRTIATTFGKRKVELDTALTEAKVYDMGQRYPPDERIRRLTKVLQSTQYGDAYTKAMHVPSYPVGRLGSALRKTTDALRPQVTRNASPEALHEKVPTTTTSPPGELADFLIRTDRLRTFGRLDGKVSEDTKRMERERAQVGQKMPLTLPKAYQTTSGLKNTIALRLHVGETGSVLTRAKFEEQYNPDAPYYGFQSEFEALARVQALNVVLILEQSPQMLQAVGLHTQPKTSFELAQYLWDNPNKVAAVNARLQDALKTLDKIPAYKGHHTQPRHTSLEGVRIAAYQQIHSNISKYMLSWLTKDKTLMDLSPHFSKNNDPLLNQMQVSKYHFNDEYELTKTLGADSATMPNEVRRLLLLTMERREMNEAEVLGRAFEQYAMNHATAWDFDTENDKDGAPCDPRLVHLNHWVNYVHANVRTTRPTFDWRVAAFELVGHSVLEAEELQRALGHSRETVDLQTHVTTLTPEHFTVWSKELARALGKSSVLAGDNLQYWTNTRKDVNMEHTGEESKLLIRYPFLVKPCRLLNGAKKYKSDYEIQQ